MIVEDDVKIRTMIGTFLKKWNFESLIVETFDQVDKLVMLEKPNILLLDINLPSFDGFYWCERIRKFSDVPIIFISSRTENMDIIMAMNVGGDDFIQKPFSLDVLVAKIQAILRRTNRFSKTDRDILAAGELLLNLENATLLYRDEEVSLTKNEYHILYLLMKNKDQIVSRDQIMNALWQDEYFIDDNTLTVNVTRLRKKLESVGLVDIIVTKKRQGYLLQ